MPARNAAETLPICLEAAQRAAAGRAEFIVVDDGSSDQTGEVARVTGATVIRHDEASGPARARNVGVKAASAEIILFLDADIVLADDSITRVLDAFSTDAGLAAVFGSYDDAPAGRRLVSDYRNLLHHFIHRSSREDSGSFWAGCGAVRKAVFLAVGGFDERYKRPSIEDIELGRRLALAGHRARLDKRITGRHLKEWTLARVVTVDVRDRAYPWARLMLREGRIPLDLNLQYRHRVSAVFVWLAIACAVGLLVEWITGGPMRLQAMLLSGLAAGTIGVILLNHGFYRFLIARRGVWFAVGAFFLHALYYAYASATFAWCWACHQTNRVVRVGESFV